MVGPKHHALAPYSTVGKPSSGCPNLVSTCPGDHVTDETKLFRTIRHGVKPEMAEVRSGVVLEAVLDDRVVLHAGGQTRRQLWESTS
jgi:hypothetical protein